MIATVYLTGHELTAASGAVAALAIIGGYLGVRSANHNALEIAREERASKREDELQAVKRTTYAQCLEKLFAFAQVHIDLDPNNRKLSESELQMVNDARRDAYAGTTQVMLLSRALGALAYQVYTAAGNCRPNKASLIKRGDEEYIEMESQLRHSMDDDLN